MLSRWREASLPEPDGGAVRVLRGGTEAELSGPLSRSLAAPLRAALAGGARTVQLDSTGGTPAAARLLAAVIGAAGADTAITDQCLSACVAVFMAGRDRWLGPFAVVGLEPAMGGADLLGLYRDAGLPPIFLPEVAATPVGQGWFPNTQDMLAQGAATAIATPDQFALAGFGPHPSADDVRARLMQVPAYRLIATVDPAGFQDDLATWTRTVIEGQPGTEAFDRTRTRLANLFQRALPRTPDALLLEHARLFIDELAWMVQHRPADCPNWARSQGGAPGPDQDLGQRRSELRLAIISAPPAADIPEIPAALPDAEDCGSLLRAWQAAAEDAKAARRLVTVGR